MIFSKLVLIVYGLMFFYFGVLLYVSPTSLANTIPLSLTDPVAIAEIRTFYGGLELGLGAFLIVAGIRSALTRPALWALLAISAGLTVGRVTGVVYDHARGGFIFSALAVEAAGLVLSAVALRITRGRPARTPRA